MLVEAEKLQAFSSNEEATTEISSTEFGPTGLSHKKAKLLHLQRIIQTRGKFYYSK